MWFSSNRAVKYLRLHSLVWSDRSVILFSLAALLIIYGISHIDLYVQNVRALPSDFGVWGAISGQQQPTTICTNLFSRDESKTVYAVLCFFKVTCVCDRHTFKPKWFVEETTLWYNILCSEMYALFINYYCNRKLKCVISRHTTSWVSLSAYRGLYGISLFRNWFSAAW